MNPRFVFAAYGAAGIGFLASIVRDYVVISHSGQDKAFFQLFYVVSMAAGFGVNAISLGSGALRMSALSLLMLVGIGVILVMLPTDLMTLPTIGMLVAVLCMWIAGAQWSRGLIERGWVFRGRVREALSSLLMAALLLAGLGVSPAFLLSVAAGTAYCWAIWRMVRLEARGVSVAAPRGARLRALAHSVVLANIATLLISYWALVQTGRPGAAFGFEFPTVVRFAMYIYQVLVIGSVVLVARRGALPARAWLRWVMALAAIAFGLAWLLPMQLAVIVVPLSAAAMHYALVLELQRQGQAAH